MEISSNMCPQWTAGVKQVHFSVDFSTNSNDRIGLLSFLVHCRWLMRFSITSVYIPTLKRCSIDFADCSPTAGIDVFVHVMFARYYSLPVTGQPVRWCRTTAGILARNSTKHRKVSGIYWFFSLIISIGHESYFSPVPAGQRFEINRTPQNGPVNWLQYNVIGNHA